MRDYSTISILPSVEGIALGCRLKSGRTLSRNV
ncbi:MAG: hypothetical protein JWO59_2023 [Chloroflexi bacterium]|nr:hypothetical protein [Chloroflexota bacterium]